MLQFIMAAGTTTNAAPFEHLQYGANSPRRGMLEAAKCNPKCSTHTLGLESDKPMGGTGTISAALWEELTTSGRWAAVAARLVALY